MEGIIDELFGNGQREESAPHITFGRVVDTNDPQQMGRLRVFCPALNDVPSKKLRDLPWATYASPFAGIVEKGSRGRGDALTTGPVAYGMWNIPKVGSTVLVVCIDGDTSLRVWLGCVHNQLLAHTMPHGRFSYRDDLVTQSGFDWDDDEGKPIGPYSSQEEKIEPTFSQLNLAFTPKSDTVEAGTLDKKSQDNFEWRTRGADHSVSGLSESTHNSDSSNTSWTRDDADIGHDSGQLDGFEESDGNKLGPEQVEQGYKESRIEPGLEFEATVKNYDSQIYSWTTPGFHAIAMDDSSTNCRMRFRTTHGHQIILDDTNERIYISVAGGKCWIEMDEKGNMDFYAERNLSFHAEKDINFTAGDTFRVKAKNGIHMISENEIRMHAQTGNLHLKAGGTTELHSIGDMSMSFPNLFLTATTDIHIKASAGILNLESGSVASIKASTSLNLESGAGGMNLLSAGQILQTGSAIHLNGPGAASAISATSSTPSNTFDAWWTNRVPEHEPWPRVMTKTTITDLDVGNTHNGSAEFTYDQTEVGREERGFDLTRNKNWHR